MIAAEITNSSTDFSQLTRWSPRPWRSSSGPGSSELPEAIAADAGYWNEQHMDEVVANKHISVLIPARQGQPRHPQARVDRRARAWMRACSRQSTAGAATENANRRSSRCSATPNTTTASTASTGGQGQGRTEWRLLMMTHNLTKLHRHRSPPRGLSRPPRPHRRARRPRSWPPISRRPRQDQRSCNLSDSLRPQQASRGPRLGRPHSVVKEQSRCSVLRGHRVTGRRVGVRLAGRGALLQERRFGRRAVALSLSREAVAQTRRRATWRWVCDSLASAVLGGRPVVAARVARSSSAASRPARSASRTRRNG